MKAAIFLLAACALLTGCQDKAKAERRKQLIEIMHGNTGDADVLAAMEKARATVNEFLAPLQKPAAGQRQFMVKKAFPVKGGKQQVLWVNNVTFDGKLLHGKLDDNTAQPGSGVEPGGSVSFPPGEIADWMFNEDGKAVGGFLLRVLKTKFPDEWESQRYGEKIVFKE